METTRLTTEEFQSLHDAIDHWIAQPKNSGAIADIVAKIVGPDKNEDGYEEFNSHLNRLENETNQEAIKRKRIGATLHYKLYEIEAQQQAMEITERSMQG